MPGTGDWDRLENEAWNERHREVEEEHAERNWKERRLNEPVIDGTMSRNFQVYVLRHIARLADDTLRALAGDRDEDLKALALEELRRRENREVMREMGA